MLSRLPYRGRKGLGGLSSPCADRGLDHAVEREKHLKPILNLRNLIMSEPSESAPLALISELKERLQIPFRPIEFIRKYPTFFHEFHPHPTPHPRPHVKLTPEASALTSEESLLFQTTIYKQRTAARLLKLLMIRRICKIPLLTLKKLSWDLGLPPDFEKSVIPEFPDYFRVISGSGRRSEKLVELVCWMEEFAGSETKKATSGEVGVVQEIMNLFVGKKAEKEAVLDLGGCFGLRSKFNTAIVQHPGIFYVSNKMTGTQTQTVLLREAFRRGMLVSRDPLMDVRLKYVQLLKKKKKPKKDL
ncbi:hypothetical protein M569_04253 [Genlisea aurea]|uniref:PORR domain-containing protein n=1 Tax=Genlisea aurea TaxID=192259 RepID=S8CTC0_9LAMI|nr:hypothetical protein M569_04253 [Genlisea aurea]